VDNLKGSGIKPSSFERHLPRSQQQTTSKWHEDAYREARKGRDLALILPQDTDVLATRKFKLQQSEAAHSHGSKKPCSFAAQPRPLKHPLRCARQPAERQGRDEEQGFSRSNKEHGISGQSNRQAVAK
jgi:hypothetical protein